MRRRHHRHPGVAHAHHRVLEGPNGKVELVVFLLHRHHEDHADVRSGTELGALVRDHDAAPVASFGEVDGLVQALDDFAADAVHLRVERHIEDAVAEVLQGHAAVRPNRGRLRQPRQGQSPRLARERLVRFRCGVPTLAHPVHVPVERSGAGREHFVDPTRHRQAPSAQHVQPFCHADGVPALERAELPAEARPKRIVDGVRQVRNLRHPMRNVGEDVGEDAAVEIARRVGAVEEQLRALGQRIDLFRGLERCKGRLLLRHVFERLEVEREDVAVAVRVLDFFVETGAGFGSQQVVADQMLHIRRRRKHLPALIVRAMLGDPIRHVDERVDAHHVARAERGALRPAHRRSGQAVHRFHVQSHFRNGVEQRLNGEHPDPVRNEGGGVLAPHHLLAEDALPITGKEVEHRRVRFRSGDDFEQLQIARRVEEVRSAEVLPEVVAPPLREQRNRNARRVRRDERSGLAVLFHPLEELLLDVEPLDDDLDDPIAVGHLREVVVEVAGGDAPRKPLRVNRGGVALQRIAQVSRRHAIARAFLSGEVQEEHFGSGLGQMARNARTHHAGAQHGHPANAVQRDFFSCLHEARGD